MNNTHRKYDLSGLDCSMVERRKLFSSLLLCETECSLNCIAFNFYFVNSLGWCANLVSDDSYFILTK